MASLLGFASVVGLPSSPNPVAAKVQSSALPSDRPAFSEALSRWALRPDTAGRFSLSVLNDDPPLLYAHGFLDDSECDALVSQQRNANAECDLYLNYRVNVELERDVVQESEEARRLIDKWNLPSDSLSAGDQSGFRTQVNPLSEAFQPILEKVKALMGLESKEVRFEEGAWVRPSRATFCIRDQTTVHYSAGEGVSPHVDGKDATVLIYLSGDGMDESGDAGGATCFPEIGVRVKPEKGSALLYWSKNRLLHYAERVKYGEKWICQLLIDFRVRDDEHEDVDWQTGHVASSKT